MICSVEDCEEAVRARGWCHAHYMRWYKRGGDPSEDHRVKAFRPAPTECAHPGCTEESEAWDWCKSHYQMARRVFKIYPKQCELCGTWYIGKRVSSHYCGRACKQKVRVADGRAAASSRQTYLRREWGMELEDYHRMLAAQGGSCAICKSFNPKGRGRFHVDHDHATGAVRGLLCHECNTALGKLGDDPELLRKAADYLDR